MVASLTHTLYTRLEPSRRLLLAHDALCRPCSSRASLTDNVGLDHGDDMSSIPAPRRVEMGALE